jgi:hypothetical protein
MNRIAGVKQYCEDNLNTKKAFSSYSLKIKQGNF